MVLGGCAPSVRIVPETMAVFDIELSVWAMGATPCVRTLGMPKPGVGTRGRLGWTIICGNVAPSHRKCDGGAVSREPGFAAPFAGGLKLEMPEPTQRVPYNRKFEGRGKVQLAPAPLGIGSRPATKTSEPETCCPGQCL